MSLGFGVGGLFDLLAHLTRCAEGCGQRTREGSDTKCERLPHFMHSTIVGVHLIFSEAHA